MRDILDDDDVLVESADKLDGRAADGASPLSSTPPRETLLSDVVGCFFTVLLSPQSRLSAIGASDWSEAVAMMLESPVDGLVDERPMAVL